MLLSKHADFLSHHNFKMLISLDGNKEHDSYRKTPNGSPIVRHRNEELNGC